MYYYFFIKKLIIAHIFHLEIFHQTSYILLKKKNQKKKIHKTKIK